MCTKSCYGKALVVCLWAGLAGSASAAPVYWVDWTGVTPEAVVGTIALPGGESVSVSYTGDYASAHLNNTGTNYWSPTSDFADGVVVGNAPSLKDLVTLQSGGGTLAFSQPVVNPTLAVVDLGQRDTTVTYGFDRTFNLVVFGTEDHRVFVQEDSTTLGGENGGQGTIQFPTTVTSIHWTLSGTEDWNGFTVGIGGVGDQPGPGPIPAPGAVLLGSMGAALVGYLRRRRAL